MGTQAARRYQPDAIRKLILAVCAACDTRPEAAADLVDAVLAADLGGRPTHGVRRLAGYLDRLQSGAIDPRGVPQVHTEGSVVSVDGANALGQHIVRVAADAVADRARSTGAAVGLVRNSNHFGTAGHPAARMADGGMVALVCSNGIPCVAPPYGSSPFMSNNPLAVAAPRRDGRRFLFDFAGGATSRDNIRQAAEAGREIPAHWAVGPDGAPTTNAEAAMAGTVLPIGGPRGFGLMIALELLAGLLPNALTDRLVRTEPRAGEGIGHFLLAVSLDRVPGGSSFVDRLEELDQRMAALPRPADSPPPRLPGTGRPDTAGTAGTAGLVLLDAPTEQRLRAVAARAGVDFPTAVED